VGGLNQPVVVVYSGDCTNVTSPNGCTATATYAGDTNHTGSSDNKSITMTQAGSTTTVTFEAGPYTYRGTAFTATAAVTGIGSLNHAVSVVYSGDCLSVTAANGCTASANFAGDTNHTSSSDNKSITITQASSTTTVTFETGPYTYRGTAFTATAAVTGVGSLNHAVSVVYSGDCTNVTSANGCTATATFPGDTDHTGSTDTKTITIMQAPTTTVVSGGGTFVYNGLSHPATVSVTGGGGLSLTPTPVYSGACSAAPVNVPDTPCTAGYTYAGDVNHTGSTGSATITITRTNQTITWNVPTTMTYGAPLNSTQLNATVVGVSGGTAPGALTYNPAAGTLLGPGPNSLMVTAAATPNYNSASKSVTIAVQYQSAGICAGDAGHQILQPINANGSSVFNGKSTSPAKFRVCDANGVSIGTAGVVSTFGIYQIVGGVQTAINEDVASTTPDTLFRWDPSAQQWIFNINNKTYPSNQTYYFQVKLNDGSSIFFNYGLR